MLAEDIFLPTKKKSTRSTARKKSIPQKTARKNTQKLSAGTYTVPRGHVSLAVPTFWTLRQTNDDLEVEAPSGSTSVIVTAFQRNGDFSSLDARKFMEHYLETAPHNGRVKADKGTKQKSRVRYKDPEGDNWEVVFVTNGDTLLLATCNSSFSPTNKEVKTGLQVLDSIKLARQ